MASSGSFTTTGGYGGRNLLFEWSQAEQSITGNYTKIDWTLKGTGTGGSPTWYMAGNFKVVIDGEIVYNSADRIQLAIGTVVASGSKILYHNDNGTRGFSASAEGGIYYFAVNSSGSGSWSLDTIARASQPSCITWPTTTNDVGGIGNSIYIYMNSKSSSFRHTVSYSWYNKTATIATNVKDNCSFTIPMNFCNDLPNAASGQGTITVDTYNGSTLVGTKSVQFTAHVPNNNSTKPSISVSLSPVNSWLTTTNTKYDDFKDLYIQGLTQVGVSITASGKYNTTIESYSTSIDGKQYTTSNFTSNKLIKSGTFTIASYATDKRGFSNSSSEQITVHSYVAPSVVSIDGQSKIICTRCDSSGIPSSSGTKLKISAKRKFSPLVVDSTQLNTCVLYYCIKESTATSYGSWQTLISNTTSATNEFSGVVSGVTLDVTKMYDIKIAVRDDLANWGGQDVVYLIPTEEIPLELANGGLNVAIGRHAKTDGSKSFDCGWDANFEKNLGIKGSPIADFVVEQGTSGIWTYRKWKSGIAECWGVSAWVLLGYTAWGNGYETASAVADKIAYPSGLFNNVPHEIAEVHAQYSGVYTESVKFNTKTKTGTYYGVRPSTLGEDYYRATFYVTGRWK